jgi:hypothetical protein
MQKKNAFWCVFLNLQFTICNLQGVTILQFNAVVATNSHALHLYERLGFTQLGKIPQGFRMKDGHYEDIIPHYILLK